MVSLVEKVTSVRMASGLTSSKALKPLLKPSNERLAPAKVILPGAEFSVTETGPVIEA
jgi:hypothetical protein